MESKLKVEKSEIKKIMGEVWDLDPETIFQDAEFGQIPEWDSLGHVNLLVALEKKYNLTIDYDTLVELVNLTNIVDYLNQKIHVG